MAESTEWIPKNGGSNWHGFGQRIPEKVTKFAFPNGSAYQLTSDGQTVTKQAIEIGDCLVAVEMQESAAAHAAETHRRVVRRVLKGAVCAAENGNVPALEWLQKLGFFGYDFWNGPDRRRVPRLGR